MEIMRDRLARTARRTGTALSVVLGVLAWCWSIGVFLHLAYLPVWSRRLLVLAAIAVPVSVFLRHRERRRLAGLVATITLIALVLLFPVRPSHDRVWQDFQSVLPTADIDEDRVTIHGYQVDSASEALSVTDRQLDLRQLTAVWFGTEKFAGWEGGAHTFLSFEFTDGNVVSVSVESRREPHETFSPITGLFRRFELIYIVGDESQVFGRRSNFDAAPSYLFPLKLSASQRRSLFLGMMERVNRLALHPEFYNSLTNNCTSNLVRHADEIAPGGLSFTDLRVDRKSVV